MKVVNSSKFYTIEGKFTEKISQALFLLLQQPLINNLNSMYPHFPRANKAKSIPSLSLTLCK